MKSKSLEYDVGEGPGTLRGSSVVTLSLGPHICDL